MSEASQPETAHCWGCESRLPIDRFRLADSGQARRRCRECLRKARREQYKNSDLDFNRARRVLLRNAYGMTVEQYNVLHDQQRGLCAICAEPEMANSGSRRRARMLSVDHDHATGKVRGLLCCRCNVVLAHARDRIDVLATAIEYLKRHNGGA